MAVLDDIYQYDRRMLLWCGKSRYYPHFMSLVRTVSRSGDCYMQILVPLLLSALYPSTAKSFLSLTLIAFAIERFLYFVLKNTLKRQRPPEVVPDFKSVIQASDQFSFPSGHTMAAFLLAGICCLCFGPLASPLYIWAAAVGSSRVILGVHFPSDILAGASLGTLIAFIVFNL